MIILTTFCILLPLISRFPKLDSSVPSLQLVIGTSLVTIDLRVDSFLLSSITVELQNCSGSLFFFRDRNCNFLADAIIEKTEYMYFPTYLLNGSSLHINYANGKSHIIAIVKSLEAFQKYISILHSMNRSHDRILTYLCINNITKMDADLRKNVFCFYNELKVLLNHSDYYYLILDSDKDPHVERNITVKSYDLNYIKSINSSSMTEHQFGADHNITLDLGYFRRENCYILNSSCNPIHPAELQYVLMRGNNLYVLAGAFESMCVLVGVILILCQVGYTINRKCTSRRRHDRGEQEEELLQSGIANDID